MIANKKIANRQQIIMMLLDNVITNIVFYMIIYFILTRLYNYNFQNSYENNNEITNENSKIYQELVRRPEQYVNKLITFNIKYLEIKHNCMIFINETIDSGETLVSNSNIKKIKKIIQTTEVLLLGYIDILNVKLYLDEKLLKNLKKGGDIKGNIYDRLVITKKDIEGYRQLDKSYTDAIKRIDKNNNDLQKLCVIKNKMVIDNDELIDANDYTISNEKENKDINILEDEKNIQQEEEYLEMLEYIEYLEKISKPDM